MKHFMIIAQVGRGIYPVALYQKRESTGSGELIETRYSFEAVIREYFKGREMDVLHLILVGTHDSNWDALLNYYPNGEVDIINLEKTFCPEDFEKRLADKLQQRFKIVNNNKTEIKEKLQIGDIRIKQVIIKQGQSGEELRSNFSDLQTAINEVRQSADKEADWDVCFDISNGFRSFPIYIYTLINYLSQTENGKTRCHMFYGMFDSKISVANKEITPLVDLQFIDDLLLLINAVSEFQNCGSVKQILEILNIHQEWDIQVGSDTNETLSYAFKMFDYGTNANNLAAIEIGINLLSVIGDKIDAINQFNDAERLLLKEISNDFSVRFGAEDLRKKKHYPYSCLMIQLARWFHETGREGNAAITVQETVLTYLMERYEDRITGYLLDKQSIGKLEMDEFNAESRLRDTKYLFNYKIRQQVRLLLKELNEEKDSQINEFYVRYQNIKDNVRDIMAHIILSEQSATDYEFYKNTINKQITYLTREITNAEAAAYGEEDRSDGNIIIEHLFSGSELQNIQKQKRIKTLREMLWKPVKEDVESDDFLRNYNRLVMQMDRMKEIGESFPDPNKEFSVFCAEQNQLDLLFKCLDQWILRDQGNDVQPETYYKRYYFGKKGTKKRGYERLMEYIEKNFKHVVPILENPEDLLQGGDEYGSKE